MLLFWLTPYLCVLIGAFEREKCHLNQDFGSLGTYQSQIRAPVQRNYSDCHKNAASSFRRHLQLCSQLNQILEPPFTEIRLKHAKNPYFRKSD